MRCRIELDAEALRNNYQIFQSLSAPAITIPVVKSNAYGHGLELILKILSLDSPPWLAVNYPEEGFQIRDSGYQGRILIVGPTDPELFRECASQQLDLILGDIPNLKSWLKLEEKPVVHLKIDTGMSRQGFHPDDLPEVLDQLKSIKSHVYGISSHFANVEDVSNHQYAFQQLADFRKAYEYTKSRKFNLVPHMASSASTLLLNESLFQMTRIGIALYGLWPSSKTRLSFLQNHEELAKLEPVLSWTTEVALIKKVKEGQYIGYGCTYRALRDMTIAVLPVGYYEGYPRIASGRGSYVLIQGRRCPIVGRICMNMMMVDISHLQQVDPKEKVTLIGRDGGEVIGAEDVAEWSDTIHYEIVTCLNPSIPRVLKN